jgi:hypothetical protein
MARTRWVVIVLFSLAVSACASTFRLCDHSYHPTLDRSSLIRRVTFLEVEQAVMARMYLETLPPEDHVGVIESVKRSVEAFRSKTLPTDELWMYRYEKCSGCRWYTEGVVALRGSCIQAELTTWDDM